MRYFVNMSTLARHRRPSFTFCIANEATRGWGDSCLPCRRKDLSSGLQHPHKQFSGTSGVAAPSMWRQFLAPTGQPAQASQGDPDSAAGPVSKYKVDKGRHHANLWRVQVHTDMYSHAHIHISRHVCCMCTHKYVFTRPHEHVQNTQSYHTMKELNGTNLTGTHFFSGFFEE